MSAQHGDLVTEQEDLDVLRCVGSGEQRQPAQHADEHQIGKSKGHSLRSCCAYCGPWLRGRLAANALVSAGDMVLGTHTMNSRAFDRKSAVHTGGRGNRMAEANQLAMDCVGIPRSGSRGHPQHQRPNRWRRGWAAWLSLRIAPPAGDQLGVPAQQGSG